MSNPAPSSAPGVRAFLGITFALTWVPFLPELWGGTAVPLLMPFAPAIACVVVRRWVTREGFGDLALRPDLGRAWPWLAVALLWPLLATPLAVAVGALAGVDGLGTGLRHLDPVDVAVWTAAALLATPVFLGEELGWRGFLQARVRPGRPLQAAAVTGVVWAVWHYPLWLSAPGIPLHVLPLMTVSLVVASVFFGWVQAGSGTVWAPAAAHSSNNTLEANLGATVTTGGTASPWLPLAPSLAVVVAEALVLLGAVALDARRRPHRGRSVVGPPPVEGQGFGQATNDVEVVVDPRPRSGRRGPACGP